MGHRFLSGAKEKSMSIWTNSDGHGNTITGQWPGVLTIHNHEHRRTTTVRASVDHEGNVTVETRVTVQAETSAKLKHHRLKELA